MIKKINIILVSLGLCLTTKLNLYYALLIPVMFYYINKDFKTLYYLLPGGLISTYLFNQQHLLSFSLTIIIIIIFYLSHLNIKTLHQHPFISFPIFVVLTNIFTFIISPKSTKPYLYLLLIIISIFIYLFITFEDYLYLTNKIKSPYIYAEHLIVILSVIGASTTSINGLNIALIVMAYFTIYYSRTYHNLNSLLIGLAFFFYTYFFIDKPISIILLLLTTLYFYHSSILFFITNTILLTLAFTSSIFNEAYLISFVFITTLFEFIYVFLIDKKLITELNEQKIDTLKSITIEKEYNFFSNFLDYFIDSFKNTKAYSEQLGKAYECIISKHCNNCKLKEQCFIEHKKDIIFSFRALVEKELPSDEFKKYCPSYSEIKKTTSFLANQMMKKVDGTNHLLLAVLKEAKIILNSFHHNVESLPLIESTTLSTFQSKLVHSPYSFKQVIYDKLFINDFNIKIILDKKGLTNLEQITKLITCAFSVPNHLTSTEVSKEIIFTLTPKEIINIEYGYGNMASKSHELCGDNYSINDFNNGHFLAIISDGMGKGYKAYEDSKKVIEALEYLGMCSTSTTTNLEILNLLYMFQGFSERYSTIDCVDINRSKAVATFYKLGASSSYIIHDNNEITKVNNSMLPLGIEESVEKKDYKILPGDLIILTSDGIIGNIINEGDFITKIKTIKEAPAQKITYDILTYATQNKILTRDDMSVIVLKVCKA